MQDKTRSEFVQEFGEKMAVAFPGAECTEFDTWLSSRLKAFNTDDSVLVPYVKGILESEEEDESEKTEALLGILCEISVSVKI